MENARDNEIYLYLNEGGFTPGTYDHLTVRLSDDDDSETRSDSGPLSRVLPLPEPEPENA